jgi:A/G-specific adenine glycosylase
MRSKSLSTKLPLSFDEIPKKSRTFARNMSFTTTILQWFRENGRALPWRETRDPYAIWLSEIILQQTRIEQGRPYWERFMQRWPTIEALAEASEDEVLRQWQGLGYYSRARNLHQAAKQVVARGGFPTTIEGLRALKGVGDYTAAAIGSFAFGLPAAVVDGNVYRVLARHFGIATPINTTEGKHLFAALAQSLLESLDSPTATNSISKCVAVANSSLFTLHSSLYNQALMDFGATHCTPQSPQCPSCPLIETCVAFREGRISELPVKQRTLKVKERHLTYVYIRYKDETALRRRPAGDIWQGLYEPLEVSSPPTSHLAESVLCGAVLLRQNVKHVLTHRVLYADFWLWEPTERPQLPEGYFWVPEADLDRYAVPRLIELLFESLNSRL